MSQERKLAIGVDIGGTTVKIGLVNLENGKVLERLSFDTPRNLKDLFHETAARVAQLAKTHAVSGIGVGIPGAMNQFGKIGISPNLPFLNGSIPEQELKSALAALRVPRLAVHAGNDANVAALGEIHFGKWESVPKNFVLFTLGTGIGGGVVSHGNIISGAFGESAELGHISIYADRPAGKQHLEYYASAGAAVRRAHELQLKVDTTKDIAALEKKGNPNAKMVKLDIAKHMANGIQVASHAYGPSIVAIGGNMSKWPGLVEEIRKQVGKSYFVVQRPKIMRAKFNDGIVGAAALVKHYERKRE